MTTRVLPPTELRTAHGAVRFPAYVPVTTFGSRYPLDDLIRPYLARLAPAVMVSLYYARQMKERPSLPLFVDSGGFASLFKDAVVRKEDGLGVLETATEDGVDTLHPSEVLDFQETYADVAFTLDFPIRPGMDTDDAHRRLTLTIANARWAIENRRRKELLLFACVQGWDVESYRNCALAYSDLPFDGIAIGGLVPRMANQEELLAIVDAVREAAPGKPLHVFGLGKPGVLEKLFDRGVQSVDSSSYVKLAADGRLWGQSSVHLPDASPSERLHLALCNLAMSSQRALPLSAAHLAFDSPLWRARGNMPNGPRSE